MLCLYPQRRKLPIKRFVLMQENYPLKWKTNLVYINSKPLGMGCTSNFVPDTLVCGVGLSQYLKKEEKPKKEMTSSTAWKLLIDIVFTLCKPQKLSTSLSLFSISTFVSLFVLRLYSYFQWFYFFDMLLQQDMVWFLPVKFNKAVYSKNKQNCRNCLQ